MASEQNISHVKWESAVKCAIRSTRNTEELREENKAEEEENRRKWGEV